MAGAVVGEEACGGVCVEACVGVWVEGELAAVVLKVGGKSQEVAVESQVVSGAWW